MDWFEATLRSRREVAGTVHVELDVPAAVRDSFVEPGQYLMVRVGDVNGPFAPATRPGVSPLELLFKPGTPLTDALESLPKGGTVQVSLAGGPGFPLEKAKCRPLLLVAAGTGQAPMRSVIQSVRADRQAYGPVTLLLGVRDSDHLAFASEEPEWAKDGIDVHVTLSQGAATWQGRKGRVQLHLPAGDLSRTIAFVVGQKQMVEDVLAELERRGLPKSQLFLNV